MNSTTSLAPAISVIIPMYNSEKYIGACLESVLAQTFKDFEIIVVDDCSTDDSCAIVESYIEKSGGRLKLFKMQTNSGNPAAPCNKGLNLSRGKYIYFMDNDDWLLNSALHIFYNFAEKSNLDVVHTDKRFEAFTEDKTPLPANTKIVYSNTKTGVDKPTLDTENIQRRVIKICRNEYGRAAWHSFVRRDLLVENEITFKKLPWASDTIWTFKVMFLAKRIAHIPQPLYIWRRHKDSTSHHAKTVEEAIAFHLNSAIGGTNDLCEFMSKQKFFQENPQYYFMALESFWTWHASCSWKVLSKLPPYECYKLIAQNLQDNFTDRNIIAYLSTLANFFQMKIRIQSKKIQELENKLKQLQGG